MTERPQVMAYLNGQSNLLSSRIKKIIDSFT